MPSSLFSGVWPTAQGAGGTNYLAGLTPAMSSVFPQAQPAPASMPASSWDMNWMPSTPKVPVDTSALSGLAQVTPPSWADSLQGWMRDSGFLGKTLPDGTKVQGWGGLALGAGQGLLNGWMGLQQLGVAKDTLAENKREFNLNFANQQKTINTALEDRQRARVAANPGAYQSVGDYMAKHGI